MINFVHAGDYTYPACMWCGTRYSPTITGIDIELLSC